MASNEMISESPTSSRAPLPGQHGSRQLSPSSVPDVDQRVALLHDASLEEHVAVLEEIEKDLRSALTGREA